MRERLVTLLGALAAVYLVFVLLVGPREPNAAPESMPTTADRGSRGLQGLQSWIESSGIRVKSLRSRYDQVPTDAALPERGNLMILTLPQSLPVRQLEIDALKDWVERGNSVLVLDGSIEVFAQPQARRRQPSSMLAALGFSLEFADAELDEADKSGDAAAAKLELDKDGRPQPRGLTIRGHHPVLQGVQVVQVRTHSLYPLSLTPKEKFRTALVLLEDPVTRSPAFWQVRIGDGTGWISGYADLFGNVALGASDNARLLANVVASSLGPDGWVVFDDMHQGLTEVYDPNAFFGDARLHATLWFIVGFWLVYVAGRSNRIAPLVQRAELPRAVDFVRAVGGLFGRRLAGHEVALGLLRHFFAELRGVRAGADGIDWDLLARFPRVPRSQIDELRAMHSGLAQGRTPDLVRLNNLINNIRKLQQ
ncbi:MAG TPA: DUF4350 domain-containing protein [Burkholderiales bacterium]|nr:DUF4350 domain-containing protein [Burkholderiales bacterium]